MVLYLCIIFVSMSLVCGFDIAFGLPTLQCEWWFVVVAILCGIVFEVVVDGLFAFLVNKSPSKWYSFDKKVFQVSHFERRFLEKLQIRKWKDKVWELGSLGGFSKEKIENPSDIKYFERFLIESNKGIVTHLIGIVFGFSVLFVFPARFLLPVSLPIAVVNAFLNLLSTMVLRYNYPRLLVIHKKLLRNSEKEKTTLF